MKARLMDLLVCVPFAVACSSGTESPEPLPTSTAPSPAPFKLDADYAPSIAAADLRALVDNPFFPAPVGARWVYEGKTDEGIERIEVVVEQQPRLTWGAMATVVRDSSRLDGVLAEDTWDWFAEDLDGNVWYLGEDTSEYEDGRVVSTRGAWEAGVNRALPGVVMLGEPRVGDVYRQEYLRGEAEDIASVVSLTETVVVPAGTWNGCLKTRDRSAIDPELDELKYYCPNVGNVLVEEGDVRVELIEYSGL